MALQSALPADVNSAFESSASAIMLCDSGQPDNPITFVNPAFTRLTGYSAQEAVGRDARFLQGPGTELVVVAEIRRALAAGEAIARELLNYRKDGAAFWNQMAISPTRNEANELTGFVGLSFDTTETRGHSERLGELTQLNDIVRNVHGYVYRRVMQPDGSIEMDYISPSINVILEIPEHIKVDAAIFNSHVHPSDYEDLMRLLHESAEILSPFRNEYRLVSVTGVERWFRAEAAPRRMPGGEVVWDGFALEITRERASQAEVIFLESHDRLTGLSNRARFRQALAQAMESLSADEYVICVLLLGVDDFQDLNDSLGHDVGDEVLRELGRRLTKFVDTLDGTVARIGGDEFALMIPAVPLAKSMDATAGSLCRLVARPMTIGGRRLAIEASIGVAIFPQPTDPRLSAAADGCAELMKQADLALHAAKRDERGGFRVYTPDLDDRFRHRVALRASLARGIAERQFELHYQPIVTLATGAVAGGEALVRWNHPTLGLQPPGQFIPIAEASGLIMPLGEWIVNEAFRQGESWRAMGLGTPRVAINLSSLQLRRSAQLRKPDFVSIVERALAKSGAEARQFEFELTESVLIDSSDETLKVLRALKAMGFSISIDDFGTGYSTFRYLRDFPVDSIKIDRSFVSRIGVDAADESIIRAMVSLARSLGVGVVGEGIETAAQLDFLRGLGCTLGQGYLFSMPLKAEDFAWMLEREMTLPAKRRTA